MTISNFEVQNVIVKPRVRIIRTGTRYKLMSEMIDGRSSDPTIIGRYIDYPDYWEASPGSPLTNADFDAGMDENRGPLIYRAHEYILGQAIGIKTGQNSEAFARFFYPDFISPTGENGVIVELGQVYFDMMLEDFIVRNLKTFKITGIANSVRPAIINMPHTEQFALVVGIFESGSLYMDAYIYDYGGNLKKVSRSPNVISTLGKHTFVGFEDPEHHEFLHVFGLRYSRESLDAEVTHYVFNWWEDDARSINIEVPLLDIDAYSTATHFDVALIGIDPKSYRAIMVIDTSSIGASRTYMYNYYLARQGMRNPGPALSPELSPYPFDDMDWTGAMTIYGLHRAEKTGRVFMWMSSRVKNSDDSYSTPVFRILSSANGIIWRKESYTSTTEFTIPAKPIFQRDQLLLISGASLVRMYVPWQMRENATGYDVGYVADIAEHVDTVEINHEVGKPAVLNMRLTNIDFLEADLPYIDNNNELTIGGLEIDVSANGQEAITLGSAVKLAPDYANDGGMLSDSYTGYGPLNAVSDYSRILDEEISPAIELHDSEALVNLDDSIAVWSEEEECIISEQPNKRGEFFLFAGTPLNSERFGLSAMINVGEGVKHVGLVWFAGDPEAFNMNETATQNHSRFIFRLGGAKSPLMFRRINDVDDWIEAAGEYSFPTNTWVRLDLQTGHNFGRGVVSIVHDERVFEIIDEDLDFSRVIRGNHQRDPRYNRRRWLAGIYALMPYCKTAKFHFDSDTEIEVENAAAMPEKGEIVIGKRTLRYTKVEADTGITRLVLDQELGEPLVAGYRILPANARIKVKYFDASTGQMRLSLDESVNHLVNAAGFQYEPTLITEEDISKYEVIDGAAFLDTHTGWYYTGSKRFAVRTDIQAAHFVAELPILLQHNASYAEIAFGLNANNYAGFSARIRMVDRDMGHGERRMGILAVGRYDAEKNYYPEKRILFTVTNPVANEYFLLGVWKVVLLYGWVHFYLDAFYLGSIYWPSIEGAFGSIAFGGGNTLEEWPETMRFRPLRIYAGFDAFHPGIWDNGVPARDMIRRFLVGRQVQIVEREDGIITLERQYQKRGEVKVLLDDYLLNYSVAHDTFSPASVLIVEGQEEWYSVVSQEIMRYVGEKEGKVSSPYLVTREQIYAFAHEELKRSLDAMMQANVVYPPHRMLGLMKLFRYSSETMGGMPKPFNGVSRYLILSKKTTLTNGTDVNTPLVMTQIGGHAYKFGED